ncbi:MAG: hypothetical protein WBE37_31305 [Bryobacteraceae bacterium]
MDAETISTLKTVCTAGGASSGFNGDSNARLEQLAEDGFLVVVNLVKAKGPSSTQKSRAYKPTEKGQEMFRKLAVKGVA